MGVRLGSGRRLIGRLPYRVLATKEDSLGRLSRHRSHAHTYALQEARHQKPHGRPRPRRLGGKAFGASVGIVRSLPKRTY